MKKLGVLFIVVLAIAIVVVGTAAYAFYSASRADFTLIVQSAEGASIMLELETSSTNLRPAETSVGVGNYSAKAGDNGDYAAYEIAYVATSNVNVKLFLSDITYVYADEAGLTSEQKLALHNARDAYLTAALKFCITMTAETYDWSKTYLSDNTLAIQSISEGSGSIYCYIKFADGITQELLPPFYDGTKISFVLNSQVQE